MQLTQSVYNYYVANAHLLDEDKRFHFASRTAAWMGTPDAYILLRASRSYIAPRSVSLADLLGSLSPTIPTVRRNTQELRQPYFLQYPTLYRAHLVLFRVRHLKKVYGIDALNDLFSILPKHELIDLRDSLLSNSAAMQALSTYAVNYCYLVNQLVLDDSESLPLEEFLKIGTMYDTSVPEQLQLFVYFYTHCIINESRFYTEQPPQYTTPFYVEMLRRIEQVIRDNFQQVSLDNKLEFLVCCRICDYKTDLFDSINNECKQSISPNGTFLIDTKNDYAGVNKSDFSASEHRNVLFMMSGTPYTPHSTLVT